MAQATANGIGIAYEIEGPADAPVLLLIHGVGAQLVRWPRGLIDRLLSAGFRVLRMDNRDVGLSTHFPQAGVTDAAEAVRAVREGRVPDLPYTLGDMAGDAAGLLDALGIDAAHVVGVSLGGMIAQVLAIGHRARVRSMAVLMSSSGSPDLPGSTPEALRLLTARAPDPGTDIEGYVAHQVALNRGLGSPGWPTPETDLRGFALSAAARAYDPAGAARQLAASRGSPCRRAGLRSLDLPTLVIHGADDMLIPPECGEDIARHVPGAWFLRIDGMGHDTPPGLFDLFAATIAANCARAA